MGGAQAIAALAYGTERSTAVAKIVGPGNRWVTEAKLLVSSRVATDLPAGPSEVLVIADETADPEACTADLLAQAEHGPDGESILVTTSARARRRRRRPRGRPRTRSSWSSRWTRRSPARTIWPPSTSNSWSQDPEALAAGVRNAGAVFLGTSAVVGDYAAGSNHVLPTGGLARGVGGLGLEAFLKPVQFVRATRRGTRVASARPSRPSRPSKACPFMPRPWRSGRDTEREAASGRVRAVRLGLDVRGRRRPQRDSRRTGDPVRRQRSAASRRAAGAGRRRASPGSTSTRRARTASYASRPPPMSAWTRHRSCPAPAPTG